MYSHIKHSGYVNSIVAVVSVTGKDLKLKETNMAQLESR